MEIKPERSLINAKSNPISSFFIGLTGLSVLIALNHWLFAHFLNTSYLQWYFGNVAAIGIGSALFSSIWGVLDEQPEVISAHPMKFAAAYMRLVGTYSFALGSSIEGDRSEAPDFDSFAGMLLSAILVVVIVVGLLVIGPLQYFVFLLCGSPGRLLSRSDRRVISHETSDATTIREIRDGEEIPADWQDISLKNKPFTLTNVIVGLLAGALKLAGLDKLF